MLSTCWRRLQVAPGNVVIEGSKGRVLLNATEPGIKDDWRVEIESFQVSTYRSRDKRNP